MTATASDFQFLDLFKRLAAEVEDKPFEHVVASTRVTELGIDSVAMMEIVGGIEDELDIVIPEDALARFDTLGDIEAAVMTELHA